MPLNAPEVEALYVGLAVESAADAVLVAAGVVGLGDLFQVSIDANEMRTWQRLRGVVARLFCPYTHADSNSYPNRYRNCAQQYPEPFPRHSTY